MSIDDDNLYADTSVALVAFLTGVALVTFLSVDPILYCLSRRNLGKIKCWGPNL